MRFFVLSVSHNWQLAAHRDDSAAMAADKTRLETLIAQTIADRAIALICEESDPRHVTVAQKMAYEHQPRIPWINIYMSSQERLEVGIWEELLNRPKHWREEAPGVMIEIGHRIPQDEIREQFFCDESIQAARNNDAESVLIICGDMHADFLADRIRAAGHVAEVDHSLTPVRYWQ